MVYCGKPSEFCGPCRKRRIKCDKREPSCTQCLKKSIQCPGYRNLLDLAFRDETNIIVQKFGTDGSKSKNWDSSIPKITSLEICRLQSVNQPISEIAFCHFLNSYATSGSPFNYLHDLFGKVSDTPSLFSSTCATALANLSRERQEPELMRVARVFYCQALKQMHKSLRFSENKLDSTLASVLVLSLFDVIALDGQMSTTSWDTHVEGAISLLEIRGVELFKSPIGKQLYIQMSNNIRVGCLQRGVPLPPKFVELDRRASVYLDFTHPVLRFWTIVDAFVDLQVMIRNKHKYKAMDFISLSLDIESMAVFLSNSLESPWLYDVLLPEDTPAEAFKNTAHRYSDHVVPRFWNTIRMTRIFVNEVMWEQAGIMEEEASQDSESWRCMRNLAVQNAQEMANDILASVPQFIQRPKSEKTPLRVTVVSGFVWPLSAVGRSELLTAESRKYAVDALFTIGNEAKISQASKVAQLLEDGEVPLTWPHIFHLS